MSSKLDKKEERLKRSWAGCFGSALELCVLASLCERPRYTYELVSELKSRRLSGVSEGTLYPLVRRMEGRGLVECGRKRVPGGGGPARKYYRLTGEGEEYLRLGFVAFFEYAGVILELMEPGEERFRIP